MGEQGLAGAALIFDEHRHPGRRDLSDLEVSKIPSFLQEEGLLVIKRNSGFPSMMQIVTGETKVQEDEHHDI